MSTAKLNITLLFKKSQCLWFCIGQIFSSDSLETFHRNFLSFDMTYKRYLSNVSDRLIIQTALSDGLEDKVL